MNKESTQANQERKNRPYFKRNFKRQNQNEIADKNDERFDAKGEYRNEKRNDGKRFNHEGKKKRFNNQQRQQDESIITENKTITAQSEAKRENLQQRPQNYKNRRNFNRERQHGESLQDIQQEITRLEKEIKLSIAELQAVEISFK